MKYQVMWVGIAAALVGGCATDSDDGGGGDDGKGDSVLGAQCRTDDIHTIQRPRSSADAYGETFDYRFRFRPPGRSDLPTLIFLPGGPGQPSIGTPSEPFVPPGFGLVQTDPRGVGCNELPAGSIGDERSFYRTDELARDVLAIVDELDLDNYVLYGVSYGTVLATVTAHLAEKGGVAPPRAVILEGVVGRAFAETEFMGQGMIDQWNDVIPVLPADAMAVLSEATPLGLTPHDWGEYATGRLPYGRNLEGSTLASELFLLSEEAVAQTGKTLEENRALLASAVREAASSDEVDAAGLRLYRNIACREIADQATADALDVVLDGGHLVPAPGRGEMCTGLALDDPFDVRNYPFTAPTYYVTGTRDPNTPPWQADYHFANHVAARTMLVVPGGGHNSMGYNLGLESMCAVPIVEDMATGGAHLAERIAACPRPVELRTAPAAN